MTEKEEKYPTVLAFHISIADIIELILNIAIIVILVLFYYDIINFEFIGIPSDLDLNFLNLYVYVFNERIETLKGILLVIVVFLSISLPFKIFWGLIVDSAKVFLYIAIIFFIFHPFGVLRIGMDSSLVIFNLAVDLSFFFGLHIIYLFLTFIQNIYSFTKDVLGDKEINLGKDRDLSVAKILSEKDFKIIPTVKNDSINYDLSKISLKALQEIQDNHYYADMTSSEIKFIPFKDLTTAEERSAFNPRKIDNSDENETAYFFD